MKSGRPSVRILQDVRVRLLASPGKGLRKLHLRPYVIRAVQELKGPDTEPRLHYCRWFRSFVEENGLNMLDMIYFND
jgi:hypothetical protein